MAPQGAAITALDASGQTLAANPTLKRGQVLTIYANGFAPGEPVSVTMDGGTTLAPATADSRGLFSYRFTVPGTLKTGGHNLAIAGASTTAAFPFSVASQTSVLGTSTTRGTSGSNGSTSAGAGSGSGGTLPFTGQPIAGAALLGLGLLVLGLGSVRTAGRKHLLAFDAPSGAGTSGGAYSPRPRV